MTVRPRALALALAGALLTWAAALEVTVDAGDGPAQLESQVRDALGAWRQAGVDVDAAPRRVAVRYGDPALLGPDVPVLVVTSDDPDVDLVLLVHPDLVDAYPGSLVYAIGLALGGTPGAGALDPRQREGQRVLPDPAQVEELTRALEADPADLNRDGIVDFEDLLLLAQRFGDRGVNLPGDLDGDGVIDQADLELLRERYVFTPLGRTGAAPTPSPPPDETLPDVPELAPRPEDEAPEPVDDSEDDSED
jgi:hypothetical protein